MGSSTPENQIRAIRVVGIGASAGGLSPLEAFLSQLPSATGMAYVVVQHLDPTQNTLLAQLLQRVTPLRVYEVEDGMRVEPNCVYVIQPNTEIRLLDGEIQVAEPSEPTGMRLPINLLFASLASEQNERAIAVVLSGMGSDGTLGLQAIKAVGGLTAVQQPDTAQFDAMPKKAIAAGCVDIIAPPAELPSRILAYVAKVPDRYIAGFAGTGDSEPALELEDEPLERIFAALERRTRHDFSPYKRISLLRRIERRMAIHQIETQALYADLLEGNFQEVELLFRELLIGVTSFFRDPLVWQFLADEVLPELFALRSRKDKLRAWVVGCSTGEEAYSLAMVFDEVIRNLPQYRDMSLQIFASDLSRDSIAAARRGHYPSTIGDKVSADRLARYFSVHEGYYATNVQIRDMVLFAQHNVILDPPFTKLDLVFCRNLLIYFDQSLQRRLLPRFHYSLRPDGVLLLGSSETVGRDTHLFSARQSKLRFYLRQEATLDIGADLLRSSFPPLSQKSKELTMSPTDTPPPKTDNLQKAADQLLLQVFAPAAVLINGEGDILYISGRTGKYLEPAAGKANWNFHVMVREGLRSPIAAALKKAIAQSEPIRLQNLQVQLVGGAMQSVEVTVQALHKPASLQGSIMIIFNDVEIIADQRRRSAKTKLGTAHAAELQQHRDEIQTLREDGRANKEELQSANEELQSTNEELQSTNEELATSEEEMQSMNEELQTINTEMQTRLDDLALAQSDMKNLLNSVDIAILFLDQKLNVRRYTDLAAKLINIRESDVGRPLTDLTTSLQYPALHDDAMETLRTLAFTEKQIETSEGAWFEVRIMPYRRLDSVIDGVVITFTDITATKRVESDLREDAKR